MSEDATAIKAQRLRRLLPAQANRSPVNTVGSHPGPRPNLVTAACSTCRRRKTKVFTLIRENFEVNLVKTHGEGSALEKDQHVVTVSGSVYNAITLPSQGRPSRKPSIESTMTCRLEQLASKSYLSF